MTNVLPFLFIFFFQKISNSNPGLQKYFHQFELLKSYLHFDYDAKSKTDFTPANTNRLLLLSLVSLFLCFFPLSVSALNNSDRDNSINETLSRLNLVSSKTHFRSELSPRILFYRNEKQNRTNLDEDINRLADRSEDIIKIQDEEESQTTKSINNNKNFKRFRCSMPTILENGIMEGKDSHLGESFYFRCNPGYKLIGPSRITCTAIKYLSKTQVRWKPTEKQFCIKILSEYPSDEIMPYFSTHSQFQSTKMFWKKALPQNFYSRQMKLKSLSNERTYLCKFQNERNVCRNIACYFYLNIQKLKSKFSSFENCQEYFNKFFKATLKESRQMCYRLLCLHFLHEDFHA